MQFHPVLNSVFGKNNHNSAVYLFFFFNFIVSTFDNFTRNKRVFTHILLLEHSKKLLVIVKLILVLDIILLKGMLFLIHFIDQNYSSRYSRETFITDLFYLLIKQV